MSTRHSTQAEDLRVVMQKMENWAHRLYPKLQFNDFIDKVERLGSKKDVQVRAQGSAQLSYYYRMFTLQLFLITLLCPPQTCLKRIRLDMPLIHDDFISKDGKK